MQKMKKKTNPIYYTVILKIFHLLPKSMEDTQNLINYLHNHHSPHILLYFQIQIIYKHKKIIKGKNINH